MDWMDLISLEEYPPEDSFIRGIIIDDGHGTSF